MIYNGNYANSTSKKYYFVQKWGREEILLEVTNSNCSIIFFKRNFDMKILSMSSKKLDFNVKGWETDVVFPRNLLMRSLISLSSPP